MEKKTLDNGVRIIYEEIPYVRSAAVGFWVRSGSRTEPENLSGISHAIEHMVFKGTATRTSAQVAEEMDAIGGQVNAFTTKELTSFYARALDSHLDVAIDLLGDIFFEPKISEEDWAVERGVILEEIGMYEDSPEDLVGEELFKKVFEGYSLGRPILGTPETLKAMNAETIATYKANNYAPKDIVVSLSGHFSDRDLNTLAERFSALKPTPEREIVKAEYTPSFTKKQKQIEQNHLCLGFPCLPMGHPDRYSLAVMNGILGAGMSSRLFQSVREQKGLCYSIYSFSAAHQDAGLLGVYTALNKETEAQAIELTCEVLRRFAQNGPDKVEVERVREQMKANVLMGLESTSARMHHLGQNELILGNVPTPDEIISRYDAVSVESVHALAKQVLDFSKLSFSAVGNVENTDYERIVKR